ncbi:hypothetical protein ABVE96_06270 [Lactiplantibacillus plantarum]|uniref:hypothetical protein n=1 Tax=Lactiplantibacillus plantarum TaxID=1590 RepID=UPI000A7730BA|nr:hypothetical protein [Lactiplantibacillus plantarum]QGX69211.1 hypothetical protein GPK32_09880 [Lactiplantibacillus plantarum]WBB03008.1 hypothetical protein O4Z47_08830 [Lactiplantibacillus plantarum]
MNLQMDGGGDDNGATGIDRGNDKDGADKDGKGGTPFKPFASEKDYDQMTDLKKVDYDKNQLNQAFYLSA